MSRPVDIPSLTPGDRVQDPFLVLEVDMRSSENSGPFTVLTLGNASGRIETAPFWLDRQHLVAGIARNHVVQVIGEVKPYRDKKQLDVSSIRVLPRESVNLKQLVPSVGDLTRYWEALDGWRSEITKPRLKRVLDLFYDDDEFRQRYGECPASVAGHHAALGGLLKHTVEVGAIARTIARAAGADPELVLAGVLLHDIGKLEAYRWDGALDYTDLHHLVGHVVLGSLMLDRRLDREPDPPCTEQERAILHHMILSHHGKMEFGSPVRPMTLEAEVLHWADNASARTASMADALREAEAFGNGEEGDLVSQRKFWALDQRRVYRGTSDWGKGVV